MARKKEEKRNENLEEEVHDDDELEAADQEEKEEAEKLSDIPIEKFLKDPKMSMLTEENDIEESTNWCPVCSEYTIFADKVCTVCGFTKRTKKSEDRDETEESTESTFDLLPSEEVIDEMNMYGGYGDEDGNKDDI